MMREAIAKIRKKLTINPQDKKKRKGVVDDDYQVRTRCHARCPVTPIDSQSKWSCVDFPFAGADFDQNQ